MAFSNRMDNKTLLKILQNGGPLEVTITFEIMDGVERVIRRRINEFSLPEYQCGQLAKFVMEFAYSVVVISTETKDGKTTITKRIKKESIF